jgi:hypothetical protein
MDALYLLHVGMDTKPAESFMKKCRICMTSHSLP